MNRRFYSNKHKANKEKKKRGPVVSFIGAFICAGISILIIVNSVKSIITAYRRSLLLDQANEEVENLRVDNLELLQEKEEIMGVDFIEEQARDRLYYVKDGEVMVVIPEDGTSNEGLDVESAGSEAHKAESGWAVWWSVLVNGV
ncbi:MAG: septum formation initiator family protein [Patescibacteria group bacterium]|nr:septum formation initiator family protein [Patescibacteria group bacterium]